MDDVSEKIEGVDRGVILRRWLENGFNRNTVAVFGTSIENLERILTTKQIPSFEIKLSYQKRLVEGGRFLYYSFPLITSNSSERFYNGDRRASLERYAKAQAIRHCFFKQTGIDLEQYDVLALAFEFLTRDRARDEAGEIFTRKFFIEYLRLVGDETDDEICEEIDCGVSDKYKLTAVKSQIDSDSLKRILSACLKRKGVIIYLNSNIFKHQIEAGQEDEEELLIVSDKPLSIDDISGIEILSYEDESALGLRTNLRTPI